jgi:type II secretory pathway component GspD/PulD (secretin)
MQGETKVKKILCAVLLSLPLLAGAEEVALNFNGIPLVQFVQSTYRAMLKRDFVISPDLLAMEKPISVSVRSIKSDDLPEFVERVLTAQGVKSELRNGVYYLSLGDCDGAGCAARSRAGGIPLTGPTGFRDEKSMPVDGARTDDGGPVAFGGAFSRDMERADIEREVFRPRYRKSDFIAAVINGVFTSKPAAHAGGAVVFSATKTQMEKILKLAEDLDVAAHKVKLSATFVEVSTTESSGLGISVIAQVLGGKVGIRLGDTSAGSLTLSGGSFQAVIDALASDGRFKQVAAPTAIVDDYERSNLSFGDSVPTIASTSVDRNGTPIQQIQYQQSGVLLNVQPAVLGSGKINVVVDGQVSTFSATTTGVSGSPTLSKRQVQTSVTLNDGELLMIGGLNNNKTVNNRTGISFLPKSWSTHSDSNANTDLVLILSASVVP